MDPKRTKRSVLGPRGRRRLGRDENPNPGIKHKDFIGGQAKVQKDLKEEGFGVFPKGWLNNCNVEPKEKKSVIFVLPKTSDRGQDEIEWEAAKLATFKRQDSDPTWNPPLNPFTQAMPFGDEQPLPR